MVGGRSLAGSARPAWGPGFVGCARQNATQTCTVLTGPWRTLAAMRAPVARFLAALLISFAVGSAHAQSWVVATLLQESNAESVALYNASGYLVDEVPRAQLERCTEVLQRLAGAYGITTPPLYVSANHGANAFVLQRDGAPTVGITTGLLRLAGEHEAYLAAVIGHELGHLQAGHAAARVERAAAFSTLGALLGGAIDVALAWHGYGLGGVGVEWGGAGAKLLTAKFSRDDEREADRLGTQAMAQAGYDPAAAAGFWRLVAGTVPGNSGAWLSTHPSHQEREAELAARAKELAPVYAANRHKSEVMGPLPLEAMPRLALAPAPPRVGRDSLGHMALMHLRGDSSFPRDPARARALSERASQAGDALGQAVYGTVLRDGIAGASDPPRGIALLKEAADRNVRWAHYQLGVSYRHGLGVQADRALAVHHLTLAAPSVIEAQELLSRIRSERP
jgi:Zn-dependent protease with chaperone function